MTFARSNVVRFRSPEHQPSQRLRELSDGYRAASDALVIAADLGCSGDIYAALWDLMQREADLWAQKHVEGRP